MTHLVAALLAALVLFASSAFAGPSFPQLTGRVVDEAQILSPQAEAAMTEKLQALETETGRQFVVATISDLQGYDIADYGYQLGRHWAIGSKERNDGVLLIVAPTERKVRIEVGYGLEPVLTDALSTVILQERVLPKFKAGDMEGGVVDGADAIIDQLKLPDDEARAKVQAAADKPSERGGDFPWWFALILFWIVISIVRGIARGGRRRRYGNSADWLIPWIIFSGGSGRGGRGGGWGGGGGGFSGGGGSFGGGGSSGSW